MLAVYVISAVLTALAPSATQQEPASTQAPAPATAEAPAPAATSAERRARRDRQVVCESRPRTGSTLNRQQCQTRQMAQNTRQGAQEFVRETQERVLLDQSLGGPK